VLGAAALFIERFSFLMNHNTLMDALIFCWPFALSLSGAVWYLYVLGYNVSVAVWVGMIRGLGRMPKSG
jgi:Cu(I)/Ag(I) efflux system membrane protein CusA/SilA